MFGSLMRFGDEEEENIMGTHMRNMNNMMNSMFSDPFGMMVGFGGGNMPAFGGAPMGGFGGGPMGGFMPPMMQMPNMNAMISDMQRNGNCHSYSSSTVMAMSNGPDGRPQVYQETSSSRSAPGGVRETKKSVCDSRTGVKKLAIGHAIGDKAHIIEKEQNLRSGEMEERQDFINLDEEESEAFNREWQQKTRQAQFQSLEYPQASSHHPHHRRHHRDELLALPESSSNTTPSSSSCPTSSKYSPSKSSRKRDRESVDVVSVEDDDKVHCKKVHREENDFVDVEETHERVEHNVTTEHREDGSSHKVVYPVEHKTTESNRSGTEKKKK